MSNLALKSKWPVCLYAVGERAARDDWDRKKKQGFKSQVYSWLDSNFNYVKANASLSGFFVVPKVAYNPPLTKREIDLYHSIIDVY